MGARKNPHCILAEEMVAGVLQLVLTPERA